VVFNRNEIRLSAFNVKPPGVSSPLGDKKFNVWDLTISNVSEFEKEKTQINPQPLQASGKIQEIPDLIPHLEPIRPLRISR